MKSIELTEEHKSKLLEMCKVLFPKYVLIIIDESSMNESTFIYMFNKKDLEANIFKPYSMYGNKKDQIETIDNNEASLIIHWFEFCMTHLTNALAGKNIKTDMFGDIEFEQARIKYLTELAKDRIKGQYHPIDYLYSEFLKLSK